MSTKDSIYVNFNEQDFIATRKQLLNSSIGTISLLKRYKELKEFRKEERKIKNEFLSELKSCSTELNNFIDTLPNEQQEEEVKPTRKVKQKLTRVKKKTTKTKSRTGKTGKSVKTKGKSILSDLEDIKAKLAALG